MLLYKFDSFKKLCTFRWLNCLLKGGARWLHSRRKHPLRLCYRRCSRRSFMDILLCHICNNKPDDFRITANGLASGYNQLDPISIVVLAIICIIAVTSTKGSSQINYIASVVHMYTCHFVHYNLRPNKSDANNYSSLNITSRHIYKLLIYLYLFT